METPEEMATYSDPTWIPARSRRRGRLPITGEYVGLAQAKERLNETKKVAAEHEIERKVEILALLDPSWIARERPLVSRRISLKRRFVRRSQLSALRSSRTTSKTPSKVSLTERLK